MSDASLELDISEPAWPQASSLISTRVPIAAPDARAGAVLEMLSRAAFDSAAEIAVCQDGRLVGVVRIEELLLAQADTAVSELMDPDPPVVAPGIDQEHAAWKAAQHGERSLAVVGPDGEFHGLIPPHRLLGVLLAEHAEDLARLGGFLHDAEAARTATAEPVRRRFVHRLPWLLIGLVGSVAAADIVGLFEGRLDEHLTLAFFIPGIVYLADAVGTQTEAIIIRGLSLGVPVRRIVLREILTGVLVGLALASLLLPVVWLRWGDGPVALAVAVSLFLACSVANAIALLLPAAMRAMSVDPAFGSGPLATVVQDLLSIIIYFAVASLLVG